MPGFAWWKEKSRVMPRVRKYPTELWERGTRLVFESGRPMRTSLLISACRLRRRAGTCARSSERGPAGRPAEVGGAGGDPQVAPRGVRAARGQRDLEGRERVFRWRARSIPSEVSVFIEEHRARFGVERICRTLGVSASAYYKRATGERSERAIDDERLLLVIRELHEVNYFAYGSRRMWKALRRAGKRVGRSRVERLMSQEAIQGAKRRGKPWRTTTPDPGARRQPDLVGRDFAATRPDELWFADFTYLRCWHGLVFFSFVIDAYSRRVVGWQFASHMRTDLVLDALRMALAHRPSVEQLQLVHHSDAGSQYTSIDYNQTLDDHGVLASIGTVGDAFDNAAAESFVDTFKTELIRDRVWRTRTQLELAIVEYVGWFNHQRLHSSLNDSPPAEHEFRYAAARH